METKAEEFLKGFHERFPGCTSDCMATGQTEAGLSSYELLAAEVNSPGVVLDLACGDGFLLSLLSPESRRIGLDMSEAELALAKQRPGLELILGNGREIPLNNASVDYVLCHMAYMLMSGVGPVTAEIHRVLKSGGVFAAAIPHPAPIGFEPDAATKLYIEVRNKALAEEQLEPSKIGAPATKSMEGIRGLLSLFEQAQFREYTVNYRMSLAEAVRYFSLLYSPGQLSPQGFENFKKELRLAFSQLPQPIATRMPILCWSAVK